MNQITLSKETIVAVLKKALEQFPRGMFFSVVNHAASDFEEFKERGIDVFNAETIDHKKAQELAENIMIGKVVSRDIENGTTVTQKDKSIIICYPNGTLKWNEETGYRVPIHTFATSFYANRSMWLKGKPN